MTIDEDLLKNVCAVNLDHIQTVSKSRIGSFIVKLSPLKMLRLNTAISFALEING